MSAPPKPRTEAEPALTLAVDMIRCDGHGICAWLLPERIRLDRWGYPVVDPAPLEADERSRAMRAVRACPRGALTTRSIAGGSGATVQR